ncbi:hypothetical protein NL676_001939 [Syzygium grande]|nr:hypothetical protein NL676_001939 [Syzygium grande]
MAGPDADLSGYVANGLELTTAPMSTELRLFPLPGRALTLELHFPRGPASFTDTNSGLRTLTGFCIVGRGSRAAEVSTEAPSRSQDSLALWICSLFPLRRFRFFLLVALVSSLSPP